MSSANRKKYLTATVLDQGFLDDAHDSLVNQLEMIVDIEAPDGSFIRASDRHKYVGGVFYEALLKFPAIERTLGDWLSGETQYSDIRLELSNADKRFNRFMPTGSDYSSWVGNTVTVRLGLRDVESTYFKIFTGLVTQVAGFGRSTYSIFITARDKNDRLTVTNPTTIFGRTSYPKINADTAGTFVPIIYGDWTVRVSGPLGSVPAFVVNSLDPMVDRETARDVAFLLGTPATFTIQNHFFEANDVVRLETDGTIPDGFAIDTDYFVYVSNANNFGLSATSGGSLIGSSGGNVGQLRIKGSSTTSARNVQLVISENDLSFFDTSNVWLKRGDAKFRVASSDVVSVGAGNKSFQVRQGTGATTVAEAAAFLFQSGDEFFVRVKGKTIAGGNSDNPVSQAKDMLLSSGVISAPEFDSNWTTFETKLASKKSRIWLQESTPLITYVGSLLEQVRLELFTSKDSKLKISSLHLDDIAAAFLTPVLTIKNWDVERSSLKLEIDDRNNFNRAKAAYAFLPDVKENGYFTRVWKNTASISAVGREISKQISLPNLYIEADAVTEVQEILRLSSAFFEVMTCGLTWRSVLLEPGDVCALSVKIGASQFDNAPILIRSIGYESEGLKLTVRMWSFQMIQLLTYSPGFAGMTGGLSATLAEE